MRSDVLGLRRELSGDGLKLMIAGPVAGWLALAAKFFPDVTSKRRATGR